MPKLMSILLYKVIRINCIFSLSQEESVVVYLNIFEVILTNQWANSHYKGYIYVERSVWAVSMATHINLRWALSYTECLYKHISLYRTLNAAQKFHKNVATKQLRYALQCDLAKFYIQAAVW